MDKAKKLSEATVTIGKIAKVNSKDVVTNLNAESLNGSNISNIVSGKGLKENISAKECGVFDVSRETSPAEVINDMPPVDGLYGVIIDFFSNRSFGLELLCCTGAKLYARYITAAGATKSTWKRIVLEDDLNSLSASLISVDDLKEVLSTEQIAKLEAKVQQRIAVTKVADNQSEMGGGNSRCINELETLLMALSMIARKEAVA